MKDPPLVDDLRVSGLNQVGVVFDSVVAFPLEIVVEGENVPLFNVLYVEGQEFDSFDGTLILVLG